MLKVFTNELGNPWNQPHIRQFSEYVFRIFFIDFSTALFEQILFHLPIKVDYNRTDGGKQQKKRDNSSKNLSKTSSVPSI